MTVKIAEQFGAKVVSGGLPGKARNCGAAAAQGKLILFLDADVILPYPYFLDNIIPEFHEKKYGAATCHIMPLSNDERDIRIHEWYNILIVMASKIKPFAPGFCILTDHHIHDMINGFDEEIKLTEDSDYVQRAAKFGKFGFLKSNIVYVSVRRFKTDGYFNVIAKYFLAGFYMLLIGKIKTNIFNYKFGHHEDKK
jgi:glycosyltransferase involved in cell wall biosynthesis